MAAAVSGRRFLPLAIIDKSTGENVGQIAFCRVYSEIAAAEIEYCVGEAFWGRGIAPEALRAVLDYSFHTPQFRLLEAYHRAANPSSGRVLEKAGMHKVATVQRFLREGKQPRGEVCYAMSREEYLQKELE